MYKLSFLNKIRDENSKIGTKQTQKERICDTYENLDLGLSEIRPQ
jgi:hypothetical protein